MANASIELSFVKSIGSTGAEIHGRCFRQQTLAISAATATLGAAVAANEVNEPGSMVARIATDDTGCYVAVGITPDPTALVAVSGSTSARRWVAAGAEITLDIHINETVAVHG